MGSPENGIDLNPTLIVEDNPTMRQRLLQLVPSLTAPDARHHHHHHQQHHRRQGAAGRRSQRRGLDRYRPARRQRHRADRMVARSSATLRSFSRSCPYPCRIDGRVHARAWMVSCLPASAHPRNRGGVPGLPLVALVPAAAAAGRRACDRVHPGASTRHPPKLPGMGRVARCRRLPQAAALPRTTASRAGRILDRYVMHGTAACPYRLSNRIAKFCQLARCGG